MSKGTIGILALQGCVTPHIPHFLALNFEVKEVRCNQDFLSLSGLVLPGGESSTMLRLLNIFQMKEILIETSKNIPTWGICAGAILMSQKVLGLSQESFGLIDINIERNAYGSQLDSFETSINSYQVAFIRAPIIQKINGAMEVLATHQNKPVWIHQGNHMVTTFHPELNTIYPSPMHKKFIELIK